MNADEQPTEPGAEAQPPASDDESPPPRRHPILRCLAHALLWTLAALLAAWGTAFLYYQFPFPGLRLLAAALYAINMVGLALVARRRTRPAAAIAAGWTLVLLAWWASLNPSNNREWEPGVALLPEISLNGDIVTIHNVRNFLYQSPSDFEARHETRTYDIRQLQTLDFILVHWGVPLMGHTMVSFGFADGQYLCISIEARKEKAEAYSPAAGLFRRYELTYVIADERDVIGSRTNIREGEEVCLFRVKAQQPRLRALFIDYLEAADDLWTGPAWYNTILSNCTTNIRHHAQVAGGGTARYDIRLLFNGLVDAMLYQRGILETGGLSLDQLRDRCLVNARARQAGDSPDFSRLIRVGIPGVDAGPPGNP